jgi:hypothetical protein
VVVEARAHETMRLYGRLVVTASSILTAPLT